jgi:hypothetical protein
MNLYYTSLKDFEPLMELVRVWSLTLMYEKKIGWKKNICLVFHEFLTSPQKIFGKRVSKYLFKSKNGNSGGEKETWEWEEKNLWFTGSDKNWSPFVNRNIWFVLIWVIKVWKLLLPLYILLARPTKWQKYPFVA